MSTGCRFGEMKKVTVVHQCEGIESPDRIQKMASRLSFLLCIFYHHLKGGGGYWPGWLPVRR